MSANPHDSVARFNMICLRCERQILARVAWVGREVQCPHCSAYMCVPPAPNADTPARARPPRVVARQQFNFGCPRCKSLLESHAGMSGQSGSCPTCAAQFEIPFIDPRSGAPQPARLLNTDVQDPTPLHAYAASGTQAPKIIRLDDNILQIECPRCAQRCDIDVNNCPNCGVPFTIEGAPRAEADAGTTLGYWSMTLGIISIPFCFLLVVGGAACLLGLASWLRSASDRPRGPAIAGIALGLISLAIGLTIVL